MPQVARNHSAFRLFTELSKLYPGIERAWLRDQLNEVIREELKKVRRDVMQEAIRSPHYHAYSEQPQDSLLTARKVIANIDRRIAGEHI